MTIHKITLSVAYNSWLKHLDTQLNEPTDQSSIKFSNVVKPTNKTRMTTSISSEAQKFVDGTERHCCFLQTAENLILLSLTEKNLKIGL